MLGRQRREVASRIRASYHRARRRCAHERGFALIEVVVSAALLMVVAVGVLSSIDGPQNVSANSKANSTAGDLAQQDQERMRALPASQLLGYTATRNVPVGSVNYTVESKVVWVRDGGDTDSCTSGTDNNSGDYLKLTSKVSSNATKRPVQLDSLLAVPLGALGVNKGNLSVMIKDESDDPVVGLPVTLGAPANQTVSTNDAGCAFFGGVDVGSYTVTYSKTGWVTPAGVNAVSVPTAVTAATTNVLNQSYAPAASIDVTVNTKVGGVTQASPTGKVTVANGSLPAGTLTFNATGNTATASNLYPFPSGYGVWGGGCLSGNPVANGQASVPTATPAPGGSASITVIEPSITPVVSGQSISNGADFVVTSKAAGCNEVFSGQLTSTDKFPDPGFPYGTYDICIEYKKNNYAQVLNFANNDPAGKTATLTAQGKGSC